MAIPNSTDLKKMDYSFHGEPFVDIPSKDSFSLSTMDYSFNGQPFTSNPSGPTGFFDALNISEHIEFNTFPYTYDVSVFDAVDVLESTPIERDREIDTSDSILILQYLDPLERDPKELNLIDYIDVSELTPVERDREIISVDNIRITENISYTRTSFINVHDSLLIVEKTTVKYPVAKTIKSLVVGGGGSGGRFFGGGGGAGGFIYNASLSISPGSYPVVVGNKGADGGGISVGLNGGNSSFAGMTAYGGGGGGNLFERSNGNAGGSGGGAACTGQVAGGLGGHAIDPTQGYDGGDSGPTQYWAAGGGGAGAVGAIASYAGGNGGAGQSSTIQDNSTKWYAGGGGGGTQAQAAGGTGGSGVGGNGGANNFNYPVATPGAPNTGSGGGGSGGASTANTAGGTGTVIVRYLTTDFLSTSSGGTKTTVGSDTVHTFLYADSGTNLVLNATTAYVSPVDEVLFISESVSMMVKVLFVNVSDEVQMIDFYGSGYDNYVSERDNLRLTESITIKATREKQVIDSLSVSENISVVCGVNKDNMFIVF